MSNSESEKICVADGDFFTELLEMEEKIIAEVDAKLEQEKKNGKQ